MIGSLLTVVVCCKPQAVVPIFVTSNFLVVVAKLIAE